MGYSLVPYFDKVSSLLSINRGFFNKSICTVKVPIGVPRSVDSAKPLPVVWDNGRGNAVVCGKRPNLLIFAQLRIHVKYIELVVN